MSPSLGGPPPSPQALVDHFRITPSGETVEAAHRLYRIALQRGFTRGRRVNQVRGGHVWPVAGWVD